MGKYRDRLPQLGHEIFLIDGGIETTLIFHEGQDLPHFAAFHLLADGRGTEIFEAYYRRYALVARLHGTGFILESATWRASPDWGQRLGYAPEALDQANRRAVRLLHELRASLATDRSPMSISGCVGPRGDGYDPGRLMTAEEAQAYHARQIGVFADAGVDLATAITMTNVGEAVGVTCAARACGLPVVISFTVETDGRLPTGERLGDAVRAVDAATAHGPAYYMISCAHPDHFAGELAGGEAWVSRIRGLRANASRCSHVELDGASELDAGDPAELGRLYGDLHRRLPHITVLGGCCGTDHRHIDRIAQACAAAVRARRKAA
jgi:S-methylmethionine-dependent homocysteine/selenocysteine methylase